MTTTRRHKFRLKNDVLIKARIRKGLTQGELAALLGTGSVQVSRIERGDPVTPRWVPLLAKALDLDQDEFVDYL